jgi:hypothetical protein
MVSDQPFAAYARRADRVGARAGRYPYTSLSQSGSPVRRAHGVQVLVAAVRDDHVRVAADPA